METIYFVSKTVMKHFNRITYTFSRTYIIPLLVQAKRLSWAFWLIWFINQRALYSHAFPILHRRRWCHWHHWFHLCTPLPATGLNIGTSYLVFICTYYMHIKYLVILTCRVSRSYFILFFWQNPILSYFFGKCPILSYFLAILPLILVLYSLFITIISCENIP